MAKGERPRYRPPVVGRAEAARTTLAPAWILREAGEEFGLDVFETMALLVICDNLDRDGASKTAISLIAKRGRMGRTRATEAVESLVAHGLIFPLDEQKRGRIVRWALPPEMPWHP